MSISVYILQRSLNKGRYRDTLQFETVRELRFAYSNIWHASRQTLTTSVMARDLRNVYITSCPTYGLWFERFVVGIHKRMRDEVRQDQAVSLAVVYKLVDGLDRDYLAREIEEKREGFVDQAIFDLAAFLAAMREEKMSKLVLGEVRSYFAEARRNSKFPHAVLPLRDRFKGQMGETLHFVLVTVKGDLGFEIGPWMERGIVSWEIVESPNITSSLTLGEGGGRSRDLEVDILYRIAREQQGQPALNFFCVGDT